MWAKCGLDFVSLSIKKGKNHGVNLSTTSE